MSSAMIALVSSAHTVMSKSDRCVVVVRVNDNIFYMVLSLIWQADALRVSFQKLWWLVCCFL